jgi:hypothetical protein
MSATNEDTFAVSSRRRDASIQKNIYLKQKFFGLVSWL